MRLRQTFFRATVLLFALVLVTGVSRAQEQDAPPAQEAPAAMEMSMAQVVLSKMHLLNQMEMQLGQLAWERGGTELLRNYGERIFHDHRLGDNKVTNLADELDIALVGLDQLPGEEQQMQQMQQQIPQLQEAQGEQFDRMFLQMMVQSHEMAIQTLREASVQLEVEEVRGLVETLIPILEQHLELAQHLQS